MSEADETVSDDAVARRLAALSSNEIVDALRARRAPAVLRAVIAAAAHVPSARLGRALARFDARIGRVGLERAALAALTEFGAEVVVEGACPSAGPVLVVVNHPGAYDALALMVAVARSDAAFVVADRAFLRAMPRLSERLVFVGEGSPNARAVGVRGAIAWLRSGRALVQFGAGTIEPDTQFQAADCPALASWPAGTGLLARAATTAGAVVVPSFVQGVHSARAKRLPLVRWAERRNVMTIAPLVQATLPGFRDVRVSVRFGSPLDRAAIDQAASDADRTRLVRDAVLALVTRAA